MPVPFNLLCHLSIMAPLAAHTSGLKLARTSRALRGLLSLLNMEAQALEPAKAGTCSFRSAHSVQFTSGGDEEAHLLVCDGMGKLALHEAGGSCSELKEVDQESATSVACLTVSPSGHHFACASDQNHVKVYKLPSLAQHSMATRFSQSVRAMAYSSSGTTLAAGGDDGNIKLVDVAGSQVLVTLVAGDPIRSIAYDPASLHMAAVTCNGTLHVWEIATRTSLSAIEDACPEVESGLSTRCTVAWQPEQGQLLAAPGRTGVVLYERLSWTAVATLAEGTEIQTVCFSPDGKLLAAAGEDQLWTVWDVGQRKQIAARRLSEVPLSDMSWHPSQGLAAIDEQGGIYRWTPPQPSSAADSKPAGSTDLQADVSGMEDGGQASGALSGDSLGDFLDNDLGEDGDGPSSSPQGMDLSPAQLAALSSRPGQSMGGPRLHRQQDAIQPGSTPFGEDVQRRWLTYNALGGVNTRQDDGFNAVEVVLHDSARARRRPAILNDFYFFSMAALGPQGPLYASKANADAPSMVVFRPLESWTDKGEWSLALPEGENVVAVAAGHDFLAAATSARLLRLFSITGLQTGVLALEGAAVALAAEGQNLALVWHKGLCQGRDQSLGVAVWDMAEQVQAWKGSLPLSPASTLTWLGFSEAGMLAAYDSQGVLRIRAPQYGGTWVPVFSASEARKGSEVFWPVAVGERELTCVICQPQRPYPTVLPPPVLSSLPLAVPVVPVAGPPGAGGEVEGDLVLLRIILAHLQATDAGTEEEATRQKSVSLEADRTLLKLFKAAVPASRLPRALDLASRLEDHKALEGAIKLANHHRSLPLAERISEILEQRSMPEIEPDRLPDPEQMVGDEESEPSLPAMDSLPSEPDLSPVLKPLAAARPKVEPLQARTNLADASHEVPKRKLSSNPFMRNPRPRA